MATCSLFQSISFLQQTKCKYHTTHWNNYSNFISNLHLLLDLWRNLIEFNPCNTFFSCSYIPLYCKKGVCRYLRHLLCQEHAEMRECETEGGRDKVSTKLTLFLLWNEINHNPTDLNWAPAHYNIFPSRPSQTLPAHFFPVIALSAHSRRCHIGQLLSAHFSEHSRHSNCQMEFC